MRKMPLVVLVGGSLLSAALAHAQAGAPVSAPTPAPLAAPGDSAYPQLQDPEGGSDLPAAAPEPAPTAAPTEPPPPSLGGEVLPTSDAADAQFLTLDRVDGVSRAGVELSYISVDSDDTLTPVRLGLWGQYVAPSGVGGFGALDLSYLGTDGDSETAIGNLEVGALYAANLASIQGVGRASILLPTAGDELGEFVTNFVGIGSRITDLTHAYPNSTWLRLSASPIVRRPNFLLRADLGIDIALHVEDDEDIDPIAHGNLAAAYVQGPHQLGAEFVTLFSTGSDDNERLHSLGVSYRGTFGELSPFGGVSFPFASGDGSDDDLGDFAITGGVSSRF